MQFVQMNYYFFIVPVSLSNIYIYIYLYIYIYIYLFIIPEMYFLGDFRPTLCIVCSPQ